MMPERPDDPATVAELNQLQADDFLPVPAVPVVVTGDVRTQELPAKLVTFSTMYVDNKGRRLAARDERRAKISVAATTAQSFAMGTSLADVMLAAATSPAGSGGAAFVVTQGMGVVDIEGADELYAISLSGTPAVVSVKVEQWTD
jgi:hypothetical protein